jgi:hypothetical protein
MPPILELYPFSLPTLTGRAMRKRDSARWISLLHRRRSDDQRSRVLRSSNRRAFWDLSLALNILSVVCPGLMSISTNPPA